MKKIYVILMGILLFIPSVVFANVIESIDIEVYIDNNGNAHINEIWDTDTDENTEFYKGYYNLGSSEITNFKVSMNDIVFENITWDIDNSFNEKKYKYGYYYNDDGIELCFGISEYGDNTYYLSYDISNFIVSTDDNYQMLYWTLIMPSSDKIEKASIRVYSDFYYDSDLFVKAYGKGGIPIYSNNGYISMTGTDFDSDEYTTLLVKFDDNTFNTGVTLDKDFDEYLNMAETGATSYNEKTPIVLIIFMFLFSFAFVFIIVIAVIYSTRYGTYRLNFGKTKNIVKEKGYYRDIPYKKEELSRAYWIACQYNLILRQTDYLGALLLKWLKMGNIKIEKDSKDKSIIILNNSTFMGDEEVKLYDMMFRASSDGRLERKEFQRWCNNNYSKILKWFNDVIDGETEKLISEGILIRDGNKKKCIVNPCMMDEARKLKGLKNFLNDFSNIKDKNAIQVNIWDEYLMYAMIFGIAKKVMKEFKELYPEVITDEVYDNFNAIYFYSYNTMTSASSNYSSSGGGGGSFGGGGSMGSR